MSDAGDFVDAALQREASWERAEPETKTGLRFYGSSVGAVRGTVRDTARRHPGMTHDDVTALSSELWTVPVFERRLAAIVLLQSNLGMLKASDLTRIEGFLRTSHLRSLVDPLAVDVVGPLVDQLDSRNRERADVVIDRWAHDDDSWLRRAALLSPLRPLRAGGGNWESFVRRARLALAADDDGRNPGSDGDSEEYDGDDIVRGAVTRVLDEMAKTRPELRF